MYWQLDSCSLGGPFFTKWWVDWYHLFAWGNLNPQNSNFQFVSSKKQILFTEIRTWWVFISFPFHGSHWLPRSTIITTRLGYRKRQWLWWFPNIFHFWASQYFPLWWFPNISQYFPRRALSDTVSVVKHIQPAKLPSFNKRSIVKATVDILNIFLL